MTCRVTRPVNASMAHGVNPATVQIVGQVMEPFALHQTIRHPKDCAVATPATIFSAIEVKNALMVNVSISDQICALTGSTNFAMTTIHALKTISVVPFNLDVHHPAASATQRQAVQASVFKTATSKRASASHAHRVAAVRQMAAKKTTNVQQRIGAVQQKISTSTHAFPIESSASLAVVLYLHSPKTAVIQLFSAPVEAKLSRTYRVSVPNHAKTIVIARVVNTVPAMAFAAVMEPAYKSTTVGSQAMITNALLV